MLTLCPCHCRCRFAQKFSKSSLVEVQQQRTQANRQIKRVYNEMNDRYQVTMTAPSCVEDAAILDAYFTHPPTGGGEAAAQRRRNVPNVCRPGDAGGGAGGGTEQHRGQRTFRGCVCRRPSECGTDGLPLLLLLLLLL